MKIDTEFDEKTNQIIYRLENFCDLSLQEIDFLKAVFGSVKFLKKYIRAVESSMDFYKLRFLRIEALYRAWQDSDSLATADIRRWIREILANGCIGERKGNEIIQKINKVGGENS